MKKSTSWLAALLILAGSPPALRAAAPPLFAPEPPEPAAGALVEAYLPLLVAGQYEQALTLVDLRGLRQYLLDRRLADLRAKNAELTEAELSCDRVANMKEGKCVFGGSVKSIVGDGGQNLERIFLSVLENAETGAKGGVA